MQTRLLNILKNIFIFFIILFPPEGSMGTYITFFDLYGNELSGILIYIKGAQHGIFLKIN